GQVWQGWNSLGLEPMTRVHSACVTSCRARKYGRVSRTACRTSCGSRSASSGGGPLMKVPGSVLVDDLPVTGSVQNAGSRFGAPSSAATTSSAIAPADVSPMTRVMRMGCDPGPASEAPDDG